MANFIRGSNPIWYFVDLVGLGLNDQYYLHILQNTFPYLPQPIYQDVNGTIFWSDPIQFLVNGTLPDNMYWDDSLVYRLEVRQGPAQTDPLIYVINNFDPGAGSGTPSNLQILNASNQISNPQFAFINFVSPLIISSAGTYNIAPGWDLILTGAGTTTITQLAFSGSDFNYASPAPFAPFALEFDSNGWTSVVLQQTFNMNAAIFDNGAISASITARSYVNPQNIFVNYVPNPAASPTLSIISKQVAVGNFQEFKGAVNLNDLNTSNQTVKSTTAQILIQVVLPATGKMDVTNVQIVGQSQPLPVGFDIQTSAPSFNQDTIEREIDHLFHYYSGQLITKPKKSLLVGWNFPQNPFQFSPTALTAQATQTVYVADQTILHQETANNLKTGKGDLDQRLNFVVSPQDAATNTRFALIQYIDPKTIRPYWSYVLSSLVKARIFTQHNSQIHLKMRLIYSTVLPNPITGVEPIASWPLGADPIFSASWTAISPLNDPAYLLQNNYDNNSSTINAYPSFSFNQFQLPNASTANMTLGIVIYTMDRMNGSAGTQDSINFDSISLVPNKFAVDSPPQTFDEVLRECQFYYEKSYPVSILPTSTTANGSQIIELGVLTDGSKNQCWPKKIFQRFKQTKSSDVPSSVKFYSMAGTANNVTASVVDFNNSSITAPFNVPITQWTLSALSADSITLDTNNTSANIANISPSNSLSLEGFLQYHYTVDAVLGGPLP